MRRVILTCCVTMCFTTPAHAYMAASINKLSTKVGGTSFDFNALGLTFGVKPNDYIALEGRYTHGLNSETKSVDNYLRIEGEIEKVVGLYSKFFLTKNKPFRPFVMLGYSYADARGKVKSVNLPSFPSVCDFCPTPTYIGPRVGETISQSENDISYGFGFDIESENSGSVRFEYAWLVDDNNVEVNELSVGYQFNF